MPSESMSPSQIESPKETRYRQLMRKEEDLIKEDWYMSPEREIEDNESDESARSPSSPEQYAKWQASDEYKDILVMFRSEIFRDIKVSRIR